MAKKLLEAYESAMAVPDASRFMNRLKTEGAGMQQRLASYGGAFNVLSAIGGGIDDQIQDWQMAKLGGADDIGGLKGFWNYAKNKGKYSENIDTATAGIREGTIDSSGIQSFSGLAGDYVKGTFKDDKGLFQGGEEGRMFGRARDYMDKQEANRVGREADENVLAGEQRLAKWKRGQQTASAIEDFTNRGIEERQFTERGTDYTNEEFRREEKRLKGQRQADEQSRLDEYTKSQPTRDYMEQTKRQGSPEWALEQQLKTGFENQQRAYRANQPEHPEVTTFGENKEVKWGIPQVAPTDEDIARESKIMARKEERNAKEVQDARRERGLKATGDTVSFGDKISGVLHKQKKLVSGELSNIPGKEYWGAGMSQEEYTKAIGNYKESKKQGFTGTEEEWFKIMNSADPEKEMEKYLPEGTKKKKKGKGLFGRLGDYAEGSKFAEFMRAIGKAGSGGRY